MALPTRSTISGRRNTASSPGEPLRQVLQNGRQRAELLLGDRFSLAKQLRQQKLALDEAAGFVPPAPVADLRVVVGRFSGPRDLVRRRRARRVAFHLEAHVLCRIDDGRAPLRPVCGKVFRNPYDARELSLPAVLLHADTEAPVQVPGEGIAVDRARRLDPAVDRVLMQGTPLAVLMGPGCVEDQAVGVELRVVVAAGAVLEHGRGHIGGQRLDRTVRVADAGVAAVAEDRLFQRHTRRVVVGLLDLAAQAGIGDGPQGGDALVRAEGHVETGRAPLAAGVARELARAVGRKTVIEAVELAAVDLRPVVQVEQALGVEPDPVRLLARRVVLVGMAEGALALQVVRGGRRLGQGRYHGAASTMARRAGIMRAAGGIRPAPQTA